MRKSLQPIAIASCLALVAACSGVKHRDAIPRMKESFQAAMSELSEAGSINCGHKRIGEVDGAMISCVAEAISSRRPFRASEEVQGIDSFILEGLTQSSDGKLFLIRGDSDVTGGGRHRAEPRVWRSMCSSASSSVPEQLLQFCVNPVDI